MRNDLKPCPFCGAEAKPIQSPDGHRVECSGRFANCPMNMRTHQFSQREMAVRAWNTRAPSADLKAAEKRADEARNAALREAAELADIWTNPKAAILALIDKGDDDDTTTDK